MRDVEIGSWRRQVHTARPRLLGRNTGTFLQPPWSKTGAFSKTHAEVSVGSESKKRRPGERDGVFVNLWGFSEPRLKAWILM
jgi:hypothetical protein